jgi:hypothetical protein
MFWIAAPIRSKLSVDLEWRLNAAWGMPGVVGLMLFVSVAGLVATAALAHAVNEERLLFLPSRRSRKQL